MNIVGISGLANAIAFKQERWPGRDAREYRISQGHDSASALIVDGRVVAAVAEERISRAKHTSAFPGGAIRACLDYAGMSAHDIDILAHGFDYAPYRALYSMDPYARDEFRRVYSREALLAQVNDHLPGFPHGRVRNVAHHLAHAASAYYTSGWDHCLVLVVDGMGEAHSVTAYRARNGALDRLASISARDSIGILYSLVTLHLGFDFNADEYKIMGLAPYGDASRFQAFFENEVQLLLNGMVRIPLLHRDRSREQREFHQCARGWLAERLAPPREPDEPLTDVHRDIAAALQQCLDRALHHVCAHFARQTGERRLALAGGVALNCTANGRLLRAGVFDDIYVQPAAGDDGSALGAALVCAAEAGEVSNERMSVPFLGPEHSGATIRSTLADYARFVQLTEFASTNDACADAARRIADGRVVAWYRGRMEYGPRALGHRSILANPAGADMRERINAMVKMREAFRPFAPAVTLEEVDRWFDVSAGTELPFMIMTVDVREQHRGTLPAVTHVDGSARVQTVARGDNADFHTLLQAVGRETGREMVLNTSFNVKGQPIVNTPREALDTFLGTGIEYLYLENTLVARRD